MARRRIRVKTIKEVIRYPKFNGRRGVGTEFEAGFGDCCLFTAVSVLKSPGLAKVVP